MRVKTVYSIEKGDAQPEVPLDLNLYPQSPPQAVIGFLEYVTGRVIKGTEESCCRRHCRRHLWHSQLLAPNVLELVSPLYPQLWWRWKWQSLLYSGETEAQRGEWLAQDHIESHLQFLTFTLLFEPHSRPGTTLVGIHAPFQEIGLLIFHLHKNEK